MVDHALVVAHGEQLALRVDRALADGDDLVEPEMLDILGLERQDVYAASIPQRGESAQLEQHDATGRERDRPARIGIGEATTKPGKIGPGGLAGQAAGQCGRALAVRHEGEPMARSRGCVVVGGGLAAATLVQTLREGGFAEPLTLIGEESDRPYERPALSKDYLQGRATAGDLYVHPEAWYAEHQVETRFANAVTEIDPGTCSVRLRSGETVVYSQLVLATGASPRTLSLPGVDLAEVYTLRRIGQAEALRSALTPGRRLVIIGAGWIGLEVAASARSAGCEVTVLEAATVPLSRVLGKRLGRYFTELHRQHGVDLRTDTQVTAILGRGGRVIGVETDHDVIPADLVLVAVGVTPTTEPRGSRRADDRQRHRRRRAATHQRSRHSGDRRCAPMPITQR